MASHTTQGVVGKGKLHHIRAQQQDTTQSNIHTQQKTDTHTRPFYSEAERGWQATQHKEWLKEGKHITTQRIIRLNLDEKNTYADTIQNTKTLNQKHRNLQHRIHSQS